MDFGSPLLLTAHPNPMEKNLQPPNSLLDTMYQEQLTFSHSLRLTTAKERVAKLERLHAAISAHEDELMQAMWEDFKKPSVEVKLTELAPLYMEIKYFKKNLSNWMRPKRVSNHFPFLLGKSVIHYEPKGVVLIIAPWNYPFYLALAPLIAAVAAGNAVTIKPSEFTPHTTKIIGKVIASTFAPEEVRVVEGGIEASQALLEQPFHHIFFTGSTPVGREIMKAAAKHLAGVTLELGGKSPAIIDESADLQTAAAKLMWGKFLNAGQTCIAPDYVLINKDMIEVFVAALGKAMETFKSKDETSSDMSAIVSERHYNRMRHLLQDATEKGAKILLGGHFDDENRRLSPTVISPVDSSMLVMQEEIFGPILPLVGVNHTQDAINYINAHDKPLALYVFSKNDFKINQILQQTSSGGSCINDVVVHITNPELPFGGINQSGFGNYHGLAGFKTFSHEKSVFHQFTRFNVNKMLYPPYGPQKQKLIKWLMRLIK